MKLSTRLKFPHERSSTVFNLTFSQPDCIAIVFDSSFSTFTRCHRHHKASMAPCLSKIEGRDTAPIRFLLNRCQQVSFVLLLASSKGRSPYRKVIYSVALIVLDGPSRSRFSNFAFRGLALRGMSYIKFVDLTKFTLST